MLCAALGSFNPPKCVSIRAAGLVAVNIEQISRIQSVLLLQHIPFFLAAICYETCAVALGGASGTTAVKELNCQRTGVKARWQASKQAIRSIAFSADGKLIVSGGDDGKLMAWWLTPEYQLDRVKSPIGREIYHSDRKINSIDLKTIDRGVAIVTGSEDFQVKLHQLMN